MQKYILYKFYILYPLEPSSVPPRQCIAPQCPPTRRPPPPLHHPSTTPPPPLHHPAPAAATHLASSSSSVRWMASVSYLLLQPTTSLLALDMPRWSSALASCSSSNCSRRRSQSWRADWTQCARAFFAWRAGGGGEVGGGRLNECRVLGIWWFLMGPDGGWGG